MKKLIKNLKNMYEKGGDGNYLYISKDPFYLQIAGGKKSQILFIIAVSNDHLEEKDFLTEDQLKKFDEFGFEKEKNSGNFSKDLQFNRNNFENIADEIVKTLKIYDLKLNEVDLELALF